MGFEIVEKTACRMGQLDDELLVEGVEVRLAVKAHDGDAAALFDGHIVKLHDAVPPRIAWIGRFKSSTGCLRNRSAHRRYRRPLRASHRPHSRRRETQDR